MAIHILVLGQSNVASHGGGALLASAHGRVWHDGKLSPLADPILGGSGDEASIWPRFADHLAARGDDQVVISMRAVGGSGSDEWGAGGRHFASLMHDADAIAACPVPVTHVVFHQGERDTLIETDRDTYAARIAGLIDAVHDRWRYAPWLICRASYRMGATSAAVIAAQESLIARYDFCHRGPDTDKLGAACRHDDTHFNERGLKVFAQRLAKSFQALPATHPRAVGPTFRPDRAAATGSTPAP